MSRIGIKPIQLGETRIEQAANIITVTGPKGSLTVPVPHGINVTQKDATLIVTRASDAKNYRALHGTIRALLQNAVTGVSEGFEKKLELVGIGFRSAMEGEKLVLQLGFTHPVIVEVPSDIQVRLEKNIIVVAGNSRHSVGQFAANLRALRKPDPYKGKGIRYQGEQVRMKQGKAVKAAGAA